MKNKLIITGLLGLLLMININANDLNSDARMSYSESTVTPRGVGTFSFNNSVKGYTVLGGIKRHVNTTTDSGNFYSNGTSVSNVSCLQKVESIYPGVAEKRGCTYSKSGNNYVVKSNYSVGYKVDVYMQSIEDVQRVYTLYPSGYFYTS